MTWQSYSKNPVFRRGKVVPPLALVARKNVQPVTHTMSLT